MQRDQEERRVLQDLTHQLRGPLSAALARLNRLLQDDTLDPQARREMLAVRGLCHKANRVAGSANLYELFTSTVPRLRLATQRLREPQILKLLLNSMEDHQTLVAPERGVRFELDHDSFTHLPEFSADPQLLEQAVNNLLDNAAKYSFSQTVVRVSVRSSRAGVRIRVTNRGLRLRQEDVGSCVERGWRGQEARDVTGEGSGIGLWVADHIMKAHHGWLHVYPTDNSGETTVELLLPAVEDAKK